MARSAPCYNILSTHTHTHIQTPLWRPHSSQRVRMCSPFITLRARAQNTHAWYTHTVRTECARFNCKQTCAARAHIIYTAAQAQDFCSCAHFDFGPIWPRVRVRKSAAHRKQNAREPASSHLPQRSGCSFVYYFFRLCEIPCTHFSPQIGARAQPVNRVTQ